MTRSPYDRLRRLTLEHAQAMVAADNELTLEVSAPGGGPGPPIGRF